MKGHIRKDPRKANKINYVLIHCFSVQVRAGGLGRRKNTRRERGAIRTKTTTTRTIKRDTCKEAGNKGRPNKNNIGHEEKDTQEKEKKQDENKINKHTQTHTHTQEQENIQPKKEERQQEKQKMKKGKGVMKENQKQRHQPRKNNHNQQKHRKIDQNHDKNSSTYCRNKSSIIKMIARDLLSRRETARNIKQLSLSS